LSSIFFIFFEVVFHFFFIFFRGKGIATYFRPDIFQHCADVKEKNFQLTKLTSQSVDVISVYRSQEGKINELENHLLNLMDMEKTTLICGDFNVCFKTDRNHKIIHTLEHFGFKQLVQEETHIKGGLIDHVYFRQIVDQFCVDCTLYSPYYCALDHDALLTTVILKKELKTDADDLYH
jgi:exonuclease III